MIEVAYFKMLMESSAIFFKKYEPRVASRVQRIHQTVILLRRALGKGPALAAANSFIKELGSAMDLTHLVD